MARKIGFGRPDTEPKKSIADSYLDEFRQKHNHELSRNTQRTPKAPKVRRNWVVIIFMTVWLTFWSIGILTVIGVIAGGNPEPFLLVWLTAAIAGWIVAAAVLRKQIKGKPLKPQDNK
jgi:hypothetical protein